MHACMHAHGCSPSFAFFNSTQDYFLTPSNNISLKFKHLYFFISECIHILGGAQGGRSTWERERGREMLHEGGVRFWNMSTHTQHLMAKREPHVLLFSVHLFILLAGCSCLHGARERAASACCLPRFGHFSLTALSICE